MFLFLFKDECGLTTLRDVDRCLNVLVWFFSKRYVIEGALQRLSASGKTTVSSPDQVSIHSVMGLTMSSNRTTKYNLN